MPNVHFSSFIACYRSAIICKKTHFTVRNTSVIRTCLSVLLEDGFISSYHFQGFHHIKVFSSPVNVITKYNWIIKYSSSKQVTFVTNKQLNKLYGEGGYFLISTPKGILNDSQAWNFKIGGILLFGIF